MNEKNIEEELKEIEVDEETKYKLLGIQDVYNIIEEEELDQIPETDAMSILLKPITSEYHISLEKEFNLNKHPSLHDLLEFDFGYEILEDDKNYYDCQVCKEEDPTLKSTAIMKKYLYKPPEVLTVTLNRFTPTNNYGNYRKNSIYIEFPLILDLSKYTIISEEFLNEEYQEGGEQFVYELFGIVQHSGGM